MAISLELQEEFLNLENFPLKRKNRKRYDTTHSLADSLILARTTRNILDRINNNGSINCSRN